MGVHGSTGCRDGDVSFGKMGARARQFATPYIPTQVHLVVLALTPATVSLAGQLPSKLHEANEKPVISQRE